MFVLYCVCCVTHVIVPSTSTNYFVTYITVFDFDCECLTFGAGIFR